MKHLIKFIFLSSLLLTVISCGNFDQSDTHTSYGRIHPDFKFLIDEKNLSSNDCSYLFRNNEVIVTDKSKNKRSVWMYDTSYSRHRSESYALYSREQTVIKFKQPMTQKSLYLEKCTTNGSIVEVNIIDPLSSTYENIYKSL